MQPGIEPMSPSKKALILLLFFIASQALLDFLSSVSGAEGRNVILALKLLDFVAIVILDWVLVSHIYSNSMLRYVFYIVIFLFAFNSALANFRALAPITDALSGIQAPKITLPAGWFADILRGIGTFIDGVANGIGDIFEKVNAGSRILGYGLCIYLLFFRFTKM